MHNKPKVLISRCIEHDSCRWNGLMIASPVIREFKPHMEFLPVCPEVGIGLGVPRKPIRLVERKGRTSLENSASREDYTADMEKFSRDILQELPQFQGVVLKSNSPSCGRANVKIHTPEGNVVSAKGTGIFADLITADNPLLAVEDEGRLLNLTIREHFLTKLFTLFRLANVRCNIKEMIDFHSRNKYLFMAYNQQKQKEAGRMIAKYDKKNLLEVYRNYSLKVAEILANMPKNSSRVNVLQHLFGYFSRKYLLESEKKTFLDLLESYRAFQVPLAALSSIIKIWAAKYDVDYLKNQTFLEPYPKGLHTIFDSGKGRIAKQLLNNN